ncbi:putative secreted protein (Por secretion system target) [Lutibacter sp. Hel_I_33_5]|uniref:S8 family serine peptidase n=1 Tax=Lutibacter sp. Hel_I_33_5 TaxID=1566289 RepID=UPI0011A0239E|nr:S8 family serine peptidase [Lutibacter sp. Hel_I_33_5]TVZ56175.1 putative secreted protein (Por secretion system target) [Lutibacter sp. Hel_I_33_5]
MQQKLIKCLVLLCLVNAPKISSQDKKERKNINQSHNLIQLKKLSENFQKKALKEKEKALKTARNKDWKINYSSTNGQFTELIAIKDGNPVYFTENNTDASHATRTSHLNTNGSLGLNLDGEGMVIGIWDGKIPKQNHQEFNNTSNGNRVSIGDNSTSFNSHSTHVTGTIIGAGINPIAKGMAPKAKSINFNWLNDLSETANATLDGLLISNHSYGLLLRDAKGKVIVNAYQFGNYSKRAKSWDNIMYNAPYYLMVKSAGNDGYDSEVNNNPLEGKRNYDKLVGSSTSKNNLVVANTNDVEIDSEGNLISTTIFSGSSQGPTNDLRIKPDISGNGVNIYSSSSKNNSDYSFFTGTSMSTANVSGSLLLIQQHAKNTRDSYLKAATLKGLALHTADDIEENGPDAKSGWGLLNAKKMAETISSDGTKSKVKELTLKDGEKYELTINSDGINSLQASISWTDKPGTVNKIINSSTPILVNDLDIRITKNDDIFYPWKLTGVTTKDTGDNVVDPFERIDINNAKGSYTVTVTHKGVLTDNNQDFSLLITGITNERIINNSNDINFKKVKLYPNPVIKNENLHLNFSSKNLQETLKIVVTNSLNQKVLTQNIEGAGENNSIIINTNNLKSGIYFLRIESLEYNIVKKIIVKNPN